MNRHWLEVLDMILVKMPYDIRLSSQFQRYISIMVKSIKDGAGLLLEDDGISLRINSRGEKKLEQI